MSKITKKERKRLSRNTAVTYSLDKGEVMGLSGTIYHGKNPQYHFDPVRHAVVKVSKGIPFVRASY